MAALSQSECRPRSSPWTPWHIAETPGSMPWELSWLSTAAHLITPKLSGPKQQSMLIVPRCVFGQAFWSGRAGQTWLRISQGAGQTRCCPESPQSKGWTGSCGWATRMLYPGGGPFLPHVGLPSSYLSILLTWGPSSPQSGNSKGRQAELQGRR